MWNLKRQTKTPKLQAHKHTFPWRRKWQLAPVFLPGKSHGQRAAWQATVHGLVKSDKTKQLSTHAARIMYSIVTVVNKAVLHI